MSDELTRREKYMAADPELYRDYTLPKLYSEDEVAAIRQQAQAEELSSKEYDLAYRGKWNELEKLVAFQAYCKRIVTQARLEEATEWRRRGAYIDQWDWAENRLANLARLAASPKSADAEVDK